MATYAGFGGSGWGSGPWGGSSAPLVEGVQYDVELQDAISIADHNSTVYDVLLTDTMSVEDLAFVGTIVIPHPVAGADSTTKIQIDFRVPMQVNSAFTDISSYTVTEVEGGIPIPVVSATVSGPLPRRVVVLELGAELSSKDYYSLVISPTIISVTGHSSEPSTLIVQWVDMTRPLVGVPLEISIGDFSGEVSGGILGNPDGLVFFTPAYETVGDVSTIEVEEVSVCTKAFDEYHLPAPPDPTPLMTFGGPVSSVIGSGTVLWAPADRLGQAHMNLGAMHSGFFESPVDSPAYATLVETIDITKASFLNDPRWKTFPGTIQFKTASNLSAIGSGPTTLRTLDWPKISLVDSVPITDSVYIDVLDLELNDPVVVSDSTIIQLVTVGSIDVAVTESALTLTDSTVASSQYVKTLATDTLSLTDSIATTLVKTFNVSVSDTVSVTDSIATENIRLIDVLASDSVATSDTVAVGSGAIYDVSDDNTIDVTDSTTKALAYSYTVSDTAVTTDSVSTTLFKVISTSVSDSISVSDTVEITHEVDPGLDSISTTDESSTSIWYNRVLSDNAAVSDTVFDDFYLSRSASDSVSVSDTIDAVITVGMIDVDISETAISTTDSLSLLTDNTLSDTVSVTDSASYDVDKSRSLSDTLAVEEVVWTGAAAQLHDSTHSPVGLWQFNESLADTSGNGFTLTVETGSVTYGDIFPGIKGVILDGSTTLVYNTATTTLGRAGDITIEMLLNLNAYTATRNLVSYSNGAGGGSSTNVLYQIEMLNGSSEFTFMQENSTNIVSRTSTFINRPALNTLCHFAITRISNVIRVYVDGVLVETSSALTLADGGNNSRFRVGGHSSRGGAPACAISSLKVVPSGLTGSQVAAEYNRTLGRVYGEV